MKKVKTRQQYRPGNARSNQRQRQRIHNAKNNRAKLLFPAYKDRVVRSRKNS